MRLRHGLLIAIAAAACSGKKSEGLPPATQWNSPEVGQAGGQTGEVQLPAAAMNAQAMAGAPDPNDPHAGLDISGGDPNGGGDPGADPSADPSNPHAGMDMSGGAGGQDMTKLGLPPPDPNRPIDPKHRITGTIKLDGKLKGQVKDGTPVFLIAKHLDAAGAPSGPPVGVEKLTWKGDEIPFELTDHDSMIAGTVLDGTVLVIAHYDTDGDAISKTSGDILGQIQVTIPADKVTLTLDNPIP